MKTTQNLMANIKKVFKPSIFFILSGFIMASCIVKEPASSDSATLASSCAAGEEFNAQSRSCETVVVPEAPPVIASGFNLQLLEDSTVNDIIVEYTDFNGDLPTDCSAINLQPSDLSFVPSIDSCRCESGQCFISGITASNNFSGQGQVQINFTDNDGTSAYEVVLVNVLEVDDPPIATGASTDLVSNPFDEDSQSIVNFEYFDIENDVASAVILNLGTIVSWQIPRTFAGSCLPIGLNSYQCACATTGSCPVLMEPGLNENTGNGPTTLSTEEFSYSIVANQNTSLSQAIQFSIEPVNDPPVVNSLTDTINEDANLTQFISLSYTDPDNGSTPSSCRVESSTANIEVLPSATSCSCGATGCQIEYRLDPSNSLNQNSNTADFNITYKITDDGLDNGHNTNEGPLESEQAGTINITVTPENDPPVFQGFPTGTFSILEDEVYTSTAFRVDEGGLSDEDEQDLTIQITSSDESVIRASDVQVFYGSLNPSDEIVHNGNPVSINSPASLDAQSNDTFLKVRPVLDAVGTSTITVIINDGINSVNQSFNINIQEDDDPATLQLIGQRSCGQFDSSGQTAPVNGPTQINSLYYNTVNKDCYFSYNNPSSGLEWKLLPINSCPINKSSELGGLCDGDNCLGTDKPSFAADQAGRYYFDWLHNVCYESTGTASAEDWKVYIPRSACNYTKEACNGDDCIKSGAPSNNMILFDNMVYFDSYNKECYISQSGQWQKTDMQCRPSLVTEFSSGCPSSSQGHCIGTGTPLGNITPNAAGLEYFDRESNTCWVSNDSTVDGWIRKRGALPSIETSERTPVIINNIVIDEGGIGTSEDEARLCLKVESSNSTILDPSSIRFYYGDHRYIGRLVGSNEWIDFGDAVSSAQEFQSLTMEVIPGQPVADESALVTLTIQSFRDGNGTGGCAAQGSIPEKESTYQFDIKVNPVGVSNATDWLDIRAIGDKFVKGQQDPAGAIVDLKWSNWTLVGSGSGQGVSVLGYNIYRRKYNEEYDFSSPLNGETLLSPATNGVSYQDTTVEPNTVYYYRVYGVDSIFNIETYAGTRPAQEVRVTVPGANKALVHRWMANKDICAEMGQISDENNNFRCPFMGPGYTSLDTDGDGLISSNDSAFYDMGHDLIVDRYEVGCPFSTADEADGNCGPYGCIDKRDPTTLATSEANPVDGLVFYNRATGKCYQANESAGTWEEMDQVGSFNQNLKVDSFQPELPALSNISQAKAQDFCRARGAIDIKGVLNDDGTVDKGDANSNLPSRKEQIAMSQWSTLLKTSPPSAITSLETGFTLGASVSQCNSLAAGSFSGDFTNDDYPTSGILYTMSGTADSGIRSLITGSSFTEACSSRYGIQDLVGNMSEWASEQWQCEDQASNGADPELACRGLFGANTFPAPSPSPSSPPAYGVDRENRNLLLGDLSNPSTTYNFGRVGTQLLSGPCDTDGPDGCDATLPLENYRISSGSANITYISLAMGLPIHEEAFIEYGTPNSGLQGFMQSVGTARINNSEDWWGLNLFKADPSGENIYATTGERAGLTYGGGWDSSQPISGTNNGVWTMDLRDENHKSSNLGFRCLNRVEHAVCNYSDGTILGCDQRRGCVGDGQPPVQVTLGAIYFDEVNNICYAGVQEETSPGSGVIINNWRPFHTSCPVSEQDCDGIASCVGNELPTLNGPTPIANGVYFYEKDRNRCYVSESNSWKQVLL